MDDELQNLDRAFELGYFLHGSRATALALATEALDRLDRLAEARDKRRYYRLVGRRGAGRRQRVSPSRPQLLQQLVLILSEPHERRREAVGQCDEDDMMIHFMSRLARSGLRRNAFHVAVAVGRMLLDFSTAETLSLFDLVAQDPDRRRDEDYVRARKKVIFDELRERFGALLPVRRGPRGELRFAECTPSPEQKRLAVRGLELLVPWRTACAVPETLGPDRVVRDLAYDGHPDDEHPVEMRRIHALLHPPCLGRLCAALALGEPSERLRWPSFHLARRDDDPPGDDRRKPPPPPDDAERRSVTDELARRDELRRRLTGHPLTIRVDGRDLARWDPDGSAQFEIELGGVAELVEVVAHEAGEEVVVAAQLLPDLERGQTVPLQATALAPGRRFDFATEGTTGGLRLEIRRRGSFLTGLTKLAAGILTGSLPRRWVLAVVFAAVFTIGGLVFVIVRHEAPIPPTIRGPKLSGLPLAEVERVWIDPLGDALLERELRGRLAAHGRLHLAGERSASDAVLMPDPGDASSVQDPSRLALRLVNGRGEVLWRWAATAGEDEPGERILAELDRAIQGSAP